jgi:hypothetical protein
MNQPIYRYALRNRPPGFATVPRGWPWRYLQAPAQLLLDPRFVAANPGVMLCLPRHRHGVIGSEVELTPVELYDFEIDKVE